ncbi:LuxR C-terminal-related transcriptional regulator [Streptomyces sp. NPDC048258]|uniref:LuxR C-terminal-related transcriptional regulator n=1 Tax=Streptomyces sp. NPDC048258 TaxID=3365527 RepID=UPI00371BD971
MFWLAEDDLSYHGLPNLLREIPLVSRAVIGRTLEDARQGLAGELFDVLVIPLGMYTEAIRAAPARAPTKVLVTVAIEDAKAVTAFAQLYAVDGYLLRRDVNADVLPAIFERLLRGEVPVPEQVVSHIISTGEPGAARAGAYGIARLTEREHTVLGLLLNGLSNHQIARSMNISIHGVKRHVSNLLVKFNCTNRTEVALMAARLGITPAE